MSGFLFGLPSWRVCMEKYGLLLQMLRLFEYGQMTLSDLLCVLGRILLLGRLIVCRLPVSLTLRSRGTPFCFWRADCRGVVLAFGEF